MREQERLAIGRVTDEIRPLISSWYGSEAEIISRIPVVRKLTNSFFLRYTIKTQSGRYPGVLIKIPRPSGASDLQEAIDAQKPRPAFQREYEFLLSCMRIFENGHARDFCAVRVLDFLSRWNAIAMEELNCHSLRMMNRNGDSLEDRIIKAARWLKIFHTSMGEQKSMNVDALLLRSQFENLITKLEASTSVPIQQMSSVRVLVCERLSQARDLTMPFAQLHGDYKCGNIVITDDGRLGAVDSKLRGMGPIYSDFGRLIASILSQRWNVLTFAKLADYDHCKNAIIRGYFAEEPVQNRIMDLYAALSVLEKWEEHERSLERYGYIPFMRRTRREYFFQTLVQCLR